MTVHLPDLLHSPTLVFPLACQLIAEKKRCCIFSSLRVFAEKRGVLRNKSSLRVGQVVGLVKRKCLSGQREANKAHQSRSPADLAFWEELDDERFDPALLEDVERARQEQEADRG